MRTFIQSKSNIYVYGQSGIGKTSFVIDAFNSFSESDLRIHMIYVDCIEFYSEKLITIHVMSKL